MKKNALQIVTLVLCAVLLAATIGQGRKLDEYQQQMESGFAALERSVNDSMANIYNNVARELEEAGKVVADYVLEPTGVDAESRSLLVNVSVTLKEWREDTAVTLFAVVDGNEVTLPMTADENGTFTGKLSLPVEENCEIFLNVLFSGGGLTKRETLGGWSDISMLLPVQMHGWGGSMPVYKDGVLSIGSQEGDLEMRDGGSLKVVDTRYRLYVNGELVKEEPECLNWTYACAEGDEVRLGLFCRDEYGLGYEFTLDEFVCDENASDRGTSVVSSGTASPVLSWD